MNPIIQEDIENILKEDITWRKLYGKTVFITGAGGMIGSWMIYVLVMLNDCHDANIQIIGLMRNPSKLAEEIRNREDVTILEGDIVQGIDITGEVDYIIHTASPTNPRILNRYPVETIAANTIGTYHTLNLAKEKRTEGYLFLSSREIYGQAREGGGVAFDEDSYGRVDPVDPRSCYPEGKRAAETMCVSFGAEYGLDIKIARLAHTYGPGADLSNGPVWTEFLNDALHERDIILKSRGGIQRTYIYVADAVSALYRILLDSSEIVYNVSSMDNEVTIRGLAETVASLDPSHRCKVVFLNQGDKEIPTPFSLGILDCAKLTALGWEPRYSLEQGLKRTLIYCQTERNSPVMKHT